MQTRHSCMESAGSTQGILQRINTRGGIIINIKVRITGYRPACTDDALKAHQLIIRFGLNITRFHNIY